MFYNLKDKKLKNSNKSWVAPNVTTIGGAILEKNSNIWFNSVLREDIENINIGVKVLITVNKKILDNSLVVGSPSKITREVTKEEEKAILITPNITKIIEINIQNQYFK